MDPSRIVKDVNKGTTFDHAAGATSPVAIAHPLLVAALDICARLRTLLNTRLCFAAADCPVNTTLYTQDEFSGGLLRLAAMRAVVAPVHAPHGISDDSSSPAG